MFACDRLFRLSAVLLICFGFTTQAQASWFSGRAEFADPMAACLDNYEAVFGSPEGTSLTLKRTFFSYHEVTGEPTNFYCLFQDGHTPPLQRQGFTSLHCPSGTTATGGAPGGCAPKPSSDSGEPSCEKQAGNPANVLTGYKFQRATDIQIGFGAHALVFERFYNMQWRIYSAVAAGWRTTFTREFGLASTSVARLVLADGRQAAFRKVSGNWVPAYPNATTASFSPTRRDVSWSLVATGSGWAFTDEDGSVEIYDSNGQLLSINKLGGYTQTLNYDSNGNLSSVVDSFGRQITFTYSSHGLLQTATTPDGRIFKYEYTWNASPPAYNYDPDVVANSTVLDRVIYPDQTPGTDSDNAYVTYHYEDSNNPVALTGITDERGVRAATWTYDANGRVLSSEHAGGADHVDIAYDDVNGTRTVTNALGKSGIYYLAAGQGALKRLSKIVGQPSANCVGADTQFQYDTNGYISALIDEDGIKTQFTNDTKGRPLTRIDAAGTAAATTTTMTWHPTYRVPTQIARSGRTETYSYDSVGRLTQLSAQDTTTQSIPYATSGEIRTWTYGYNMAGLLSSIDGPLSGTSDTTTFTYDSSGFIASITNALGHVTTVTATDADGHALSMVDPNGLQIDFGYDALGRVTSITRNPGASELVESFEYDDAGNITSITSPSGETLTYEWNSAERLSAIEDGAGNRIEYAHNAMGGVTQTVVRNPLGTIVETASATFDELNRMLSIIGANSQTTGLSYSPGGDLTGVLDALGNQYTRTFDGLNNLIAEAGPLQYSIGRTYGSEGRLATFTDPRGLVTSYVYNGFGDVIQQSSPDTGVTVYHYDSRGLLTTSTDARSITTSYGYDLLGRTVSKTYSSAPAESVTFVYDSTSAGNKGIGRLTSMTDQSGSTSWKYDIQGRITSKTRVINGVSRTTGTTYDSSGLLATVSLPSGHVLTYTWLNDKIAAIAVNGSTVVSNIVYDPSGRTAGFTAAGQTFGYTYDADGRLTSTPVEGLISYDALSRITGVMLSGNSGAITASGYGYDARSRLTSSTGLLAANYGYDTNSNRTSASSTIYAIETTSNRIASTTTGGSVVPFTYDAAGNLQGWNGLAFSYNAAGRLAQLSGGGSAAYTYDGLGQRARKLVGSADTHFLYDEEGHLVGEYSASGSSYQELVWLNDLPVLALGATGNYVVLSDHLATPRAVLNATTAQNVWTWNPGPFGTGAANDDPGGTGQHFGFNLRFPGQYYDVETGNHYNYFRDYNPNWGRYLQSDPIGLLGGINTYGYAFQNPLMFTDPEGLSALVLPRPWFGPMEMTKPGEVVDPVLPIPDTGQPPNDPRSQKCLSLADKIVNLRKEVYDKRIPDLDANPGNLPERIGPGEQLRDTVRGHRKLLDRQMRRLRELEDRYEKECTPRC